MCKVMFTFAPFIVKNAREAEELSQDMAKMRVAKTERALAAYS